MELTSILSPKFAASLAGGRFLGIDIGSRTAKAFLLDGEEYHTALIPTGLDMQQTAEELLSEILEASAVKLGDVDYIVATGYGRVSVGFENYGIPSQVMTEISCHGLGAHYLNPRAKTIIDIGGQDSKAIEIDRETGKVSAFAMNDKCAAGTGRFLERVASLLELTIDELGEEALKSDDPTHISSQCVVFAESEAISLRAKGESRADIAAGIHLATARRIRNLLKRLNFEAEIVFSGGVSNNAGMRKALESLLECEIPPLPLDTIYAGALGAAIQARTLYFEGARVAGGTRPEESLIDISLFNGRIEAYQAQLAEDSSVAKIGYICTYTPLELMAAAGAAYIRLFKAGSPDIVAAGEQVTQSVYCDFTKSILGAFKEGDPLYSSLDHIYTFYTCDCMKRVGEAINAFYKPAEVYGLPRLKNEPPSRERFKTELLGFKQELETLTGKAIDEGAVRAAISSYNRLRRSLKDISELRKRADPPITGSEYLELVRGYYYLPPEQLQDYYDEAYEKLSAAPRGGERKIRLMMSGGVVADGDRRLLEIIEREIGARVVVEDHCTGLKTVNHTIPESGDPYEALAYGYLDQAPCARMKPLAERLDFSAGLAREYEVDGVLYCYLKFCPCYAETKHLFFQRFHELGIPVLEIPLDYSKSDQGQLKTRIEAFIEVLRERSVSYELR